MTPEEEKRLEDQFKNNLLFKLFNYVALKLPYDPRKNMIKNLPMLLWIVLFNPIAMYFYIFGSIVLILAYLLKP